MNVNQRTFTATLALSLLVLLPRAASPDPVRGITISTHTDGREWGTEAMEPTIRSIRDIGANWVAIHPYAAVKGNGSVRVWRVDESPGIHDYVERAIQEAHNQGLKVLIKPHLAYWGSPFSWRGEIAFDTDEEWQRFFQQYEDWIVPLAAASREADAFAVGTELDLTVEHEDFWRRIIAQVRARGSMPLTYAANWSDYRKVKFWDALDAIGIQGYFPLSESTRPMDSELSAAWSRLAKDLREYSLHWDRYVVLTELGYSRAHSTAARPWEHRTDGQDAEPLQLACLRTALEAVEQEPRLLGAFLWKWFPEPHPAGRNFQLSTPSVRRTVKEIWGAHSGG